MSWRGLHVSNAARLSLKRRCMRIEREGEEPRDIPLEDINYLVLESRQVLLTSALLAECAGSGCLVIFCDGKHMPDGVLLPFHTYYQQQVTLEEQLALSRPRQKRLWQQIIQCKIRNQAACLFWLGRKPEARRAVAALERKVASGDGGNVEAQAARLYWPAYACAPGFTREPKGEDRLNAMLNYAYALLRAVISRDLAALGFIPVLGVHHRNRQNNFNLSDDLLEPWRPLADTFVMRLWEKDRHKELFDTADRQSLCAVLQMPMSLPAGEMSLLVGINQYVASVKKWLGAPGVQVAFPDFAVGKAAREPDA